MYSRLPIIADYIHAPAVLHFSGGRYVLPKYLCLLFTGLASYIFLLMTAALHFNIELQLKLLPNQKN